MKRLRLERQMPKRQCLKKQSDTIADACYQRVSGDCSFAFIALKDCSHTSLSLGAFRQ